MKRIGIYSGAFDPVHEGHLAFARDALRQCELDKVFFLVEPRPRRKQGVKAFEHRVNMVQLAIKGEKQFGDIVLEQQRFTAADTLPILVKRFKGARLFMLMGDDTLSHFADWPHVEDLIRGVEFAIGLRRLGRQEVERRLDIIQRTRGLAMHYLIFQASKPAYSSTQIKRALKKGQTSPGLPESVQSYIEANGLYAGISSAKS